MQAGKLREWVYFLRPVKNDWGEKTSDYEVISKCRAEVTDKTGDLIASEGAEQIRSIIEVLIRRRSIPSGSILAWNERFYLIKHPERDPKRRWLKLTCEYKPQQDEYSVKKALRLEAASQQYYQAINKDVPEIWRGD